MSVLFKLRKKEGGKKKFNYFCRFLECKSSVNSRFFMNKIDFFVKKIYAFFVFYISLVKFVIMANFSKIDY